MDFMKAQGWIKAGVALVVAVLGALAAPLVGDMSFSDLTSQDWLIMLGTVLASGALVAFVDNVPGVAGGIIKALIGALGAATAVLVSANADAMITTGEKVAALSAFVVGLSAVYQIPDPPDSPVVGNPPSN